MKRITTKIILICMLLMFSFVTGFTSRDLNMRRGPLGLVATIGQIPSQLASAFSASMADSGSGLSPVDTYWNVFSYLQSKYYTAPNYGKYPGDKELTYAAIRGMLGGLGDRYTRFLDPEAWKQMQDDNKGEFQGIGAKLDKKDGEVIIKEPIAKSPAFRAGLKPGDVIMRVNGQIIHGMDLDDVVKHIRGERGTKVTLTIKRKDVPEPFDVEMVRSDIESPIVEWRMEDQKDKIGYVMLAQFTEKSDRQIGTALGDLESQGMKGLILDLRNNPGGLLEVAIDIGSRFIKDGNIVIIKQGDGTEERRVRPSKYDQKLNGMPLVVLVNGGSASASEILSGAIRDHHVGTIMGTDSFGKGLVQTIIPLDNGGAVSITEAKYLTPNLHDVNKEKIHPEIVVEQSEDSVNNDVQLKRALEVVKSRFSAGQTAAEDKAHSKS